MVVDGEVIQILEIVDEKRRRVKIMAHKIIVGGGVQLFSNCTHNQKRGGERYLISNTFGDNL